MKYFTSNDVTKIYLKSWENDAILRYAIKHSQVPAYEYLANKIGLQNFRNNLSMLRYGNMQAGDKIDSFWIDGTLKISALEQVELLKLLSSNKLPCYNQDVQSKAKEIIMLEKQQNIILYGKTGLATHNNIKIGWFIGFIEANNNNYIFALNMDIKSDSELPLRNEIVKEQIKKIIYCSLKTPSQVKSFFYFSL